MNHIRFDKLPRLRALFRSHFLAGLLVVVPIGAIAWIAAVAIQTVWGLSDLLPAPWRPEHWMPNPTLATLVQFGISLGCLLVLAFGISFVGWISKQLLGQKVLEFFSEIIHRIPVLRSVHGALDQLLRTVATGNGQQFSRVVYVDYPRMGMLALAFVTGPAHGPALPPGYLNVYVPTTPNPTSGFHLLVRETEVHETHLSVEEAFRTILSLGLAQPASNAAAADPERRSA